MSLKNLLLVFFFLVTAIGCSHTRSKESDTLIDGSQNGSGGNANLVRPTSLNNYFEMNEKDLKVFLGKAQGIQLKDTLDKVVSTLGKPNAGPYSPGKQVNGVLVKNRMHYYVKIKEEGFKNQQYDQWVTFYFDADDRLMFISSNVDGVLSKGSPTEPSP